MPECFTSQQWLGQHSEKTILVSDDLIDSFATLSGDRCPIHVDDGFAQSRGYRSRIAHGALLAALVSGIIGMELPREHGVLQQIQLSFHNPCYAGDTIRIRVEVKELIESVQTILMRVSIRNQAGQLIAKGTWQSGLKVRER